MAVNEPARAARDSYLSTDTEHEALGSLEATADYLEAVESDPDKWKWVVIALHNAVQGFMVLALRGSQSWGALRQKDIERKVRAERDFRRATQAGDEEAAGAANEIMLFSASKLATFLQLYDRIKTDAWPMSQYGTSRIFEPRENDDRCMKNLNTVRNEFAHFQPAGRLFLLRQFPAMTDVGLHVISFLVNESQNFQLHRQRNGDDPTERFENAMRKARAALDRINADYEEYAQPKFPLCGSSEPESERQ